MPEMNEITPQAKASLKSRLLVAAVLIAIVVPAFVVGSWLFFGVVAIFLCFAIYEMMHVTGKKYPWYIQAITYLIVICYVYWWVVKNNASVYLSAKSGGPAFEGFSLEKYFKSIEISLIGISVSLGLYCLIAILDKRFGWDDVAYFMTFTLILALGFQSFFFCRYYPFYLFGFNPIFDTQTWYWGIAGSDLINTSVFKYAASASLLIFVLLGTSFNDAGAYFVGSLFGKHKLNERISPHKTWEGFIGGFVIAFISCLIFGLVLTFMGYPMLPTLDKDHWYRVALLSLFIPLVSDLGDLSFSLIKRHYGVKDFGSVLKGHGGVIDRIGSDMFTCLFTSVVLIFITNEWNFLAFI